LIDIIAQFTIGYEFKRNFYYVLANN